MSSSRHFSDSRRVGKAPAPEKFNFVQTCNLLSRYIKKKGSLRNLNFEIGGNVESLESIMRPGSSQLTPIDIEDASNESNSSEDAIMESNSAPLTMFYAGRVLVFDDYPAEKAKELVHLARNINSHMATSKEKVIPDSGVPSSSAAQEWRPPLREANNSVEIGCMLSNTFKEKMNTCGAMASSSGTQEWLLQQPQAIGSSKANCIISNPVKQKVIDGASSSGAREWLAPEPEANGSCKASGLFSYPIIEKINTGHAVTSTSSAREWLQPTQPEANVSDLPIARRSSLHRFLEKRKDRAGARGPYQIQEQPASSSKSDEQLELKL